jgi:hypothetical protein
VLPFIILYSGSIGYDSNVSTISKQRWHFNNALVIYCYDRFNPLWFLYLMNYTHTERERAEQRGNSIRLNRDDRIRI